jgi:hypothetical protein
LAKTKHTKQEAKMPDEQKQKAGPSRPPSIWWPVWISVAVLGFLAERFRPQVGEAAGHVWDYIQTMAGSGKDYSQLELTGAVTILVVLWLQWMVRRRRWARWPKQKGMSKPFDWDKLRRRAKKAAIFTTCNGVAVGIVCLLGWGWTYAGKKPPNTIMVIPSGYVRLEPHVDELRAWIDATTPNGMKVTYHIPQPAEWFFTIERIEGPEGEGVVNPQLESKITIIPGIHGGTTALYVLLNLIGGLVCIYFMRASWTLTRGGKRGIHWPLS